MEQHRSEPMIEQCSITMNVSGHFSTNRGLGPGLGLTWQPSFYCDYVIVTMDSKYDRLDNQYKQLIIIIIYFSISNNQINITETKVTQ